MPSSRQAVDTMITALNDVMPDDYFDTPVVKQKIILEPGCGWGSILFPVARQFPKAQFIGYECSPIPFICCVLFKKVMGYTNVRIMKKDFSRADFSGVNIILTYLHPKAMSVLQEKIENEISGSVYTISNTFQFSDWQAVKKYPINDAYKSSVYVYKVTFM